MNPNESLLKEQLGFINKISYGIAKVTDNILSYVSKVGHLFMFATLNFEC